MKILDRSEIDDTQVNFSLIKQDEGDNQKNMVCIPYGSAVKLDGVMTHTSPWGATDHH